MDTLNVRQTSHPQSRPDPSGPASTIDSINEPQKKFFIALRCGRLANRLVLFANFIALAEEHGYRLFNFTFHSYAHLFAKTSRDIYCQYPPPRRRSTFDSVPGMARAVRGTRVFYRVTRFGCVLNERFPLFGKRVIRLRKVHKTRIAWLADREVQKQIVPARVVFVCDWGFRAPELLRRHAGVIRDYFRPIPSIENAAFEAVKRLRREADFVVGFHIRHGDYRRFREGKFYFPVLRYAEWMREMADQFRGRKVAFYVCSDEPRGKEEFPGLRVGFGPGNPAGDLCALSMCDYVIGPESTFSAWASFYGGKPMLHLSGANDRLDLNRFAVSDLTEMP